MLGVHAKLGRLLDSADKKTPVVSAAFWQERLHSDPKLIGSAIRLYGMALDVLIIRRGVAEQCLDYMHGGIVVQMFGG